MRRLLARPYSQAWRAPGHFSSRYRPWSLHPRWEHRAVPFLAGIRTDSQCCLRARRPLRCLTGQCDVYLNVAGGLKITERRADLAAAAALLSSFSGVPLSPDRVFFGEISLSGAVRAAAHSATRLKEAEKLGFANAVMPSPENSPATAPT